MLRSLGRLDHSRSQRAEGFIVACNSLSSEAVPRRVLEPSSLPLFQIDLLTLRTTRIRQRAERLAANHLLTRGLKLTAENYSCKFSEIDLIMEQGSSQLIFIEVIYRSKDLYGSPIETITKLKQERIRRTAAQFLLSHGKYQTFACRFDVIGLIENPRGHQAQWIQGALY